VRVVAAAAVLVTAALLLAEIGVRAALVPAR
jgi:hypothetical protein